MITLVHSLTHAVISPNWAWLSELGVGNDQILLPQTILTNKAGEQKVHGGMHVCLPNFGPGGDSGFAQHGYGRTMTWEAVRKNSAMVELELKGPAPDYEGLVAKLQYSLEDNSVTLQTANRTIAMSQENLTWWAIWTDQLGSYVCVEPTFGGYRFLESEKPDEPLASGESKSYSLSIKW